MEISKRYNSVPVKDNCALFAPTPLLCGSGLSDGVVNISSPPTTIATATNFGTKLTITRPPWKIIARCLHLPALYSDPGYPMVSFIFFPCQSLLTWQRIWGKIDYNSAPWKIIASCFHLPPIFGPRYPIVSFEFLPWRILLQWQRILEQNWLQLGPLWKIIAPCLQLPSYTLLSYIAWQWDRYLVPQNVCLFFYLTLISIVRFFNTVVINISKNKTQVMEITIVYDWSAGHLLTNCETI